MSNRHVLEIIDRVRSVEFDPRLKSVSGSYRFDVDEVGSWKIDVDHGRIEVHETSERADCVVRASADDFGRIMSGAQNLITAWMQGLVELEGDASLAQKLHGIIPRKARKSS
jgi:putative sterol carrier protein